MSDVFCVHGVEGGCPSCTREPDLTDEFTAACLAQKPLPSDDPNEDVREELEKLRTLRRHVLALKVDAITGGLSYADLLELHEKARDAR